ncbi:MAG: hypothetical protein GXP37_05440, partial [Chloroflexi bacterium]|nr:hypothetical protein [Chloroflexota bacterium]
MLFTKHRKVTVILTLTILSLTLLLVACQPVLVSVPQQPAPPTRTVQEVFDHHKAAFQAKDMAMLMEDYADDAALVLMDGPAMGKEAIQATFEGFFTAFPGLEITLWETIAYDNVLMLHWTAKSDMSTFPTGVDTFVIEDGKIQRQTVWFEKVDEPQVIERTPTWETSILAQGSPLHGANGLYFSPDRNLYIGSILGGEIIVMDPETGQILSRYGRDEGVIGPDDIAIAPDGSVYWGSFFTGEVGRLSPDGEKTTIAQLQPGLNPITLSDDGRLFLAQCLIGNKLWEVDPNGLDEPRLILEDPNGGVPCVVNGMDIGPDGFLYGPRFLLPGLLRINVDTGEFTVLAESYFGSAVKFDSLGHLYMAAGQQVLRLDIETGDTEVVAEVPFARLDNLAFNAQGRLFISGRNTGDIAEVLPDGTLRKISPGGMILPGGIAVVDRLDGEAVLVADMWAVREFDGASGAEENVIAQPMFVDFTIATDGDEFIATSWFDNAVAVWNPQDGSEPEVYKDFAVPLNAIRFQGDLIVAELGTHSVVRASAADPADRVALAEGLAVPAGLAASDDDLWVSDWATGIVWQIVADGQPLSEPVPVATDLAFPEGLAATADGNLVVVE